MKLRDATRVPDQDRPSSCGATFQVAIRSPRRAPLLRTRLINRNGCVARDMVLLQGARRENILYGSSTDEQRRRRAKDRATLRAKFWRVAGRVAPQSQSATAMLFRRASPAARQNSAHPVPIYEMGSRQPLLRWCL